MPFKIPPGYSEDNKNFSLTGAHNFLKRSTPIRFGICSHLATRTGMFAFLIVISNSIAIGPLF